MAFAALCTERALLLFDFAPQQPEGRPLPPRRGACVCEIKCICGTLCRAARGFGIDPAPRRRGCGGRCGGQSRGLSRRSPALA
eukprot:2368068-Rhodomonas_salina.1